MILRKVHLPTKVVDFTGVDIAVALKTYPLTGGGTQFAGCPIIQRAFLKGTAIQLVICAGRWVGLQHGMG